MKENELESNIALLKKGLSIIQRSDYFSFSIDSLLVSEFTTITKSTKKILDLGCGNGVIPLILSQKTNARIYGMEIQETSYDLATRNIQLNNLSSQIKIICDDMKSWDKYFKMGYFDTVISNPPFFKYSTDQALNNTKQLTIARHEIAITLDELIKIASLLLKNNGYFTLVHRVSRMIEIIEIMKKYNLEPKKIRFCYTNTSKNAKILLIEGVKNGKTQLKMLPPLIINKKDGGYSDEVLEMFK